MSLKQGDSVRFIALNGEPSDYIWHVGAVQPSGKVQISRDDGETVLYYSARELEKRTTKETA